MSITVPEMRIVGMLNSTGDSFDIGVIGIAHASIVDGWRDAMVTGPTLGEAMPLWQYPFDVAEPVGHVDIADILAMGSQDIESGPYKDRLVEIEVGSDDQSVLRGVVDRILEGGEWTGRGGELEVVILPANKQRGANLVADFIATMVAGSSKILGVQSCPLHGQPPVCRGCVGPAHV